MAANVTREKLLAAARLAVQDRGYISLSFRDLAKDIGIRIASVQYYFPTKGALGVALVRQYTFDLRAHLGAILARFPDQGRCIQKYTEIFRNMLLNENRMCLGGILAAEQKGLPDEVREEVLKFSQMNVEWLAKVLSLRNSPASTGMARSRALAIFAAIQGAHLTARSRNDVGSYDEIVAAYKLTGLLP